MHQANATFIVAFANSVRSGEAGRNNAASHLLVRDDTNNLMVSLLRQSDFRSVQSDFVPVVGKLHGDRGDADYRPHEIAGQLLRHAQ